MTILLAILSPHTLTFLEFMLAYLAIVGLFELVKADIFAKIRADILAEAQQQHEDTRVWLRDWFDPGHKHSVYVTGVSNPKIEAPDESEAKIREALGAQINLFPAIWTIRVCDEARWENLVKTFGKLKEFGSTAYTFSPADRTYLRGSWVEESSIEELRDALLHEAGHVPVGPERWSPKLVDDE